MVGSRLWLSSPEARTSYSLAALNVVSELFWVPECHTFESIDPALRKHKGKRVPRNTDGYHWAKENGDALSKILQWCWRLRGRSSQSYDSVMKEIKVIERELFNA